MVQMICDHFTPFLGTGWLQTRTAGVRQSSRNGRGSEEYCRTDRNSHVEELEKESEASRLGIVVYRFYRGYKRSTFCSKYCYL